MVAGTNSLTEDEVKQIYQMLLENQTMRQIASRFGKSAQTIQLIKNGRIWDHVITPDMWSELNGLIRGDLSKCVAWMKQRVEVDEHGKRDVRQLPLWVSKQTDVKYFLGTDGSIFSVTSDGEGWQIKKLRAKRMRKIDGKQYAIARLMAFTFLGQMESNGYFLKHKDANEDNNKLSNLEWVHCPRDLDRPANQGKSLTAEDIPVIRQKLRTEKVSDIAQNYHVTLATIYNIKNGLSWSWVA